MSKSAILSLLAIVILVCFANLQAQVSNDSQEIVAPPPSAGQRATALETLKGELVQAVTPEEKQAAIWKFQTWQRQWIIAAQPVPDTQDEVTRQARMLQRVQSLPAAQRDGVQEMITFTQQLATAQNLPGGQRAAILQRIIENHHRTVEQMADAMEKNPPPNPLMQDPRVRAAFEALGNDLDASPDAVAQYQVLREFRETMVRLLSNQTAPLNPTPSQVP